jgi:hypothetical protein
MRAKVVGCLAPGTLCWKLTTSEDFQRSRLVRHSQFQSSAWSVRSLARTSNDEAGIPSSLNLCIGAEPSSSELRPGQTAFGPHLDQVLVSGEARAQVRGARASADKDVRSRTLRGRGLPSSPVELRGSEGGAPPLPAARHGGSWRAAVAIPPGRILPSLRPGADHCRRRSTAPSMLPLESVCTRTG